jgi:glycosyltransferase involved in cell wall biosynthesis
VKRTKKITAFYAKGTGFSGQRFATEIALSGLRERGWIINEIAIPALDRVNYYQNPYKKIFNSIELLLKLIVYGIKVIASISKYSLIYVNVGQTKFSLLRDGLPLLIRSFFSSKQIGIISLHGSLFLNWDKNCLENKLLNIMVKTARYVTVLGTRQREKLIKLGIDSNKITILDNTCLLPILSPAEIVEKQNNTASDRLIKILYLSSLIESKGYVEFVKAIELLANDDRIAIEATICGKIVDIKDPTNKFVAPDIAAQWIIEKIAQIEQSNLVRLSWIDGAIGEEKAKLFHQTQIFILPSRYPVEAQPIVILEALASGCAIITTTVGEIPNTVDLTTALMLNDIEPKTIEKAIEELVHNREKRTNLALCGRELFQKRFSYSKHMEQWENLLDSFFD